MTPCYVVTLNPSPPHIAAFALSSPCPESCKQARRGTISDATDSWIEPNFKEGTFKNNRRLLFFPVTNAAKPWSVLAGTDPDPFKDDDARAAKVRADKSAKAKARKAGLPLIKIVLLRVRALPNVSEPGAGQSLSLFQQRPKNPCPGHGASNSR